MEPRAELWKSDGTEAGTVMVKDIRPGTDSGNPGESTYRLTVIGNTVFFDANDEFTDMNYGRATELKLAR